MKKDNVVQQKSYEFALRIIKLKKHLIDEHKEYDLARQIFRSGTSIGANIEEAIGGTTRKEFMHRLSISYREARETLFWLRLLRDAKLIENKVAESLFKDCNELLRILGSIIKTTRQSD